MVAEPGLMAKAGLNFYRFWFSLYAVGFNKQQAWKRNAYESVIVYEYKKSYSGLFQPYRRDEKGGNAFGACLGNPDGEVGYYRLWNWRL